MGIGRFAYTPILPYMTEALSLTKSEAGLIASANFLGYLVGALLAATSWVKGSRRGWLVGALAASGITTLLTAAFEAPGLALVRFAGGLASAFVLVFASSVILERLAATGRSHLAALHFAGVGIGIALRRHRVGARHVGLRLEGAMGWNRDRRASRLAGRRCPCPARSGRRERGPPARAGRVRREAVGAHRILRPFRFRLCHHRHLPRRDRAQFGRSTPSRNVAWVLVGLAGVPSVALWTMLGRRIGIFAAYAAACIVEAAGVAASVLPTTVGIVIAAAFLGGTFIGLTALGFVGARQLTSSDPRRVLALMTVAFGLGQIIGPVVGGALSDRTGSFTLPSLLAAGALVVAAGLAGILELSARHLSAARGNGHRGGGR